MTEKKTIIGLTGNIAVGKSTVLSILRELGAETIDADHIAHEAILPGQPAYEAIIESFGPGILAPDGEINRKALGSIVFNDPAALKELEAITHPAVRVRIEERIVSAQSQVIVIEAIKLLEGPLKHRADAVWVVNASPKTQSRRLVHKRGLSPAQAHQRITAQNKQADKLQQADVVIENDGPLAQTRAQVLHLWAKLKA